MFSQTMMLSSRVRPFRCAVLALVLSLLGSACAPERPPEFRVGLIGVFEGNAAKSSGLPARQGATLAVEQLNAEGGVRIGGVAHMVVLVDRETDLRADAAASVARALINLDSVDVIVGPQQSALALAAGAVAEASEVPMVTPMASSPGVTRDRQLVTRLAFLDAVQGEVLARFAFDSLGARRAAALTNAASPYGREIVALFGRTFEALGAQMVAQETFDIDNPSSHAPQVRRLVSANPDVLLLPNFTSRDSMQFALARSMGFEGTFLGSDAWDAVMLSQRVETRGSIIVANWDHRGEHDAVQAFRSRLEARFPGERPRATAAATYDAIRLLARAAERAGVRSGQAVSDSLRHTGDYEGAFGRYRFVGSADPVRGATLLEVDTDSTFVRAVVAPPT